MCAYTFIQRLNSLSITAFNKMRKCSSFVHLIIIPVLIISLHFLMAGSANATPNITTDESALLALKTRITSDHYSVLQDWNVSSSPVCNWTGVTCGSRHLRVTALNVSNMGLSGQIPPELGNLSFLVSLEMTSNYFAGVIPRELARLQRLRFVALSYNNFTGEVPPWFAFLPQIRVLSLGNNNFTSLNSFLDSLEISSNETKLETLDISFNSLRGNIPESIGNLRNLRILNLGGNQLSGVIPSSIANMSSLEALALSSNYIEGTIPQVIGNLSKLNVLDMQDNRLTGSIPHIIFNISTLEVVALTNNSLSGTLPDDMCLQLHILKALYLSYNGIHGQIPSSFANCPQLRLLSLSFNNFSGIVPPEIGNLEMLEELYLTINNLSGTIPSEIGQLRSLRGFYVSGNMLTGSIPNSVSNCSELTFLELGDNKLTGAIPNSLGDLRHLEWLNLEFNYFTSDPELSFITSLTNCRRLTRLGVSGNPLNGTLPASMGNLSSSLQYFRANDCGINGYIPNEIGNLSGLLTLYLSDNNLYGVIPTSFQDSQNLQRFSLVNNQLGGYIPNSLCNLKKMGELYMSQNQLIGPIPKCLGNVSSLRKVYLNSNNLTSSIPDNIWDLKDLLELDISSNSVTGFLSPQIQNFKALTYLNLSMNHISGDLPSTFQSLQSVINFSLAHNNFHGSIPDSIGDMLELVTLDLSHNSLSGTIPESIQALRYLEYLDVSFNELSGEIPSGGPFVNLTSQSFVSNPALCGLPRYQVSPCEESNNKSKMKKELRIALIIIPISALVVFTAILSFIFIRRRRKNDSQTVSKIFVTPGMAIFSYYEILQATNGFGESNLLGKGSSGSVYKGVFKDETILAIKVFNMQMEGDVVNTFTAECEVLRNLRHRNLTKVISSCSNLDFKALVLEYMPNGSLDKWLYSSDNVLSLMQRLNIMMNVACALEYLHHGLSTYVVHCDLKPSNVLLDEDMIAHVSDFGIAKLLGEGGSIIYTRTLATMGYMAPEYGLEGGVSTRCDVYSYGIMLLETFTRKPPTDAMFSGDLNLKTWVKDSLPNGLSQVIDTNLIRAEEGNFSKNMNCISLVLELALRCSEDSPGERMSMKEVLIELKNIMNRFTA